MGILNKHGVIEGGEDISIYDVEHTARAVINIVEYNGFWFYGVNVDWRGPGTGGYGFAPSLNENKFAGYKTRGEAILNAKIAIKQYVLNVLERSNDESMEKYLLPVIAVCEQRSLFDGF